jgi:hypothetical protein
LSTIDDPASISLLRNLESLVFKNINSDCDPEAGADAVLVEKVEEEEMENWVFTR